MTKKRRTTLYCFSPPVMLATFFVEVSLIIYTLWRYKLTPITRIIVSILAFLAIFQLSEFMVCGGMGVSGVDWARLGFVAITLLPPLGIHLANEIAQRRHRKIVWISYALSAMFISFFLVVANAIEHKVCGGNYIIFNLTQSINWLYATYYYGLLVVGLAYCWMQANRTKKPKEARALRSLAAGYALFMIPTITVNLLDQNTISGIPSIMCGFAVVLAFTTVFFVAPNVVKFRNNTKLREKLRP